ncbi:MFS transporter [Bacteroides sp. GM023]|uniref:MFS transporter n=1 Tax=Bacteroides sp. GM023 TaxID=2723058 RepID=UPI00168BB929|nr:MFS transporter [Bacteroides sp. GM023]MBD3592403.1 MFS transporter [Bacteroides sp. GM023]
MNNWKKKFIIIWSGQLFSILSSSIAQFAIVLWISLETGSAEVLSLATIAALLPQVVLGPFAGVFVDRWSRKWTMILADSFVALCSAVIALLFYLDVIEIWQIYLLLMLRSIGSAFHAPAMKSSIPLLAPEKELTRIASINQTIQALCNICGPVLGAALIVSTNMSVVMLLDVVGAAIACTSLLFVFIPNPEKTETETTNNVLRDMKDGFIAIRSNRGLKWVTVTEILITFFIMPVVALIPLMTLKNFSGTAYQVSLIELLFGSGALVGGILLGIWNPRVRKVVMINLSYVIVGVSIFITGLLPPSAFIIYAIMAVVQGISMPFYSGPFTALLQTQIEVSFLGRVFSLFDSISLLPSILGLLATGFIADAIGIANVFVICGIAIVMTGLLAFFIPSIMNLERK